MALGLELFPGETLISLRAEPDLANILHCTYWNKHICGHLVCDMEDLETPDTIAAEVAN